ncbi:MAG TPA: helix-turn-helix transcriptional regulator [Solirubrobacteraceae bacterium]|nr:helix-turn-helix transcriptional regulator [Solirubrobacteraceae bacterium]
MLAGRCELDRLVDDVARLGSRGLPREQYYAEVTARLRRVVPSDAACWHTLDPQTRLMTSDAPHELISEGVFTADTVAAAGALLIASEYFVEDVNTFAALASRRVPVGTLAHATSGHPERSARYRDLLSPAGIPHELRAVFVSRGRCWGAVHLARREHQPDFSARDVATLASVAGVIAGGIRASLRFDAGRRAADTTSPGLVVLGPHDDVEMITPPAYELLAAMRPPAQTDDDEAPPSALLALAAFTRGRPQDPDSDQPAVAVPTSSGWITLHSSLADGGTPGRVAIVLERAASPESTAIRLEIQGVTAREREIATLLARGLTNPQIAARLVLSPYTVQDHIKSLFDKTGVSSRQELVAHVFLDEYLPELAAGTPLTSTGSFAR